MQQYDTVIRQAHTMNGSSRDPETTLFDAVITDGHIVAIATSDSTTWLGDKEIAGKGRVLAPGFIDVRTHDDTNVTRMPDMLCKASQGITTVIMDNCGISMSPVTPKGDPSDPMNLLGPASAFAYPTFASYMKATEHAQLAMDAVTLVGRTALRNNRLGRLDRPATAGEAGSTRVRLRKALTHDALGLSTDLARVNTFAPTTEEMMGLAKPPTEAGAIYTMHLHIEFAAILDVMDEAYRVGKHACMPVVILHLKCTGAANWGHAGEVLKSIEGAQRYQPVGYDYYPYTASPSTLDLKQVAGEFDIFII